MLSDGNKASSDPCSEPTLCVNGCGFFGSPATMSLCSKCFRDLNVQDQQTSAITTPENQSEIDVGPSTVDSEQSPPTHYGAGAAVGKAAANRCLTCKKKIGVMGFTCKCGSIFCGSHRNPEKHNCEFDFKGSGRDAIAKANPVVRTDKVDRF